MEINQNLLCGNRAVPDVNACHVLIMTAIVSTVFAAREKWSLGFSLARRRGPEEEKHSDK